MFSAYFFIGSQFPLKLPPGPKGRCYRIHGEHGSSLWVNLAFLLPAALIYMCWLFLCKSNLKNTLCNLISFTCLKEVLNKWNGRIWKSNSCGNFSNCTGDNNKHLRLNIQQEAKICFWIYLIFSFVTHMVYTNNRLM